MEHPNVFKEELAVSASPQKPATAIRSLKIEMEGDRYCGFKPKIRLQGNWLDRAGFKAGSRVMVTCLAPGLIELRSPTAIEEAV